MKLHSRATPLWFSLLCAVGCATVGSTDGGADADGLDADGLDAGDAYASGGAASGGAPGAGGLSAAGGSVATGGAFATGGAVSTGGAPSTGGVAATGGAVSTGGASATGGASSTGGAASTGGSAGTGGSSSVAACGAGTTSAATVPTVLTWEKQTGAAKTDDNVSGATGPVSITIAAGVDPYLAAVLTPWAASSRACLDVSAFTGVEFDLTTNASPIILKVGVSAADPSGSCSPADATAGNCYAHPSVVVSTTGTNVRVPFSTLQAAGWGVNAPFDP